MTNQKYILEGKEIIPVSLSEWAEWFKKDGNRIIDRTELDSGKLVSTVFLSIDHNWREGAPLLFETMVFGDDYEHDMERYSTYDEAVEGHKRMCEKHKIGVKCEVCKKVDCECDAIYETEKNKEDY